jgi:hypothetical protein
LDKHRKVGASESRVLEVGAGALKFDSPVWLEIHPNVMKSTKERDLCFKELVCCALVQPHTTLVQDRIALRNGFRVEVNGELG